MLALTLALGLAACGDKGKLEAAAESAAPKAITTPVELPTEPAQADADKELAERVARAIEAGNLYGIGVEAAGGAVTLFGATLSARDRERAVRIAANIEGVKSVESRLEIVTGS
jgi:osmotically-inducible protein OsmY